MFFKFATTFILFLVVLITLSLSMEQEGFSVMGDYYWQKKLEEKAAKAKADKEKADKAKGSVSAMPKDPFSLEYKQWSMDKAAKEKAAKEKAAKEKAAKEKAASFASTSVSAMPTAPMPTSSMPTAPMPTPMPTAPMSTPMLAASAPAPEPAPYQRNEYAGSWERLFEGNFITAVSQFKNTNKDLHGAPCNATEMGVADASSNITCFPYTYIINLPSSTYRIFETPPTN